MKPDPLPSASSPTGDVLVPSSWVPYILIAVSVLQFLGAEFALPGPWTPERMFFVASGMLNLLVGGALQGLRIHRRMRQ